MTTPRRIQRRVRVEGDLFHGRVPLGGDGRPAMYAGRAAPGLKRSVYANPHPIGKPCKPCGGAVHDRAESLARYGESLPPDLVEQACRDLDGRDAACWCKPGDACHVDILLDAVAALRATP